MSNTDSASLTVDRLIAEYHRRLAQGEQVDQAEFIAAYPEHGIELRRYFAADETLRNFSAGVFHTPDHHPGSGDPSDPKPNDAARVVGDFRIIRQVGHGGMGVVYEAEQISLGRHVALKVLPFGQLQGSQQLQRFKNEAQAAAGLYHANIVPVYSIGDERGIHYYAMHFVDGFNLAEMIQSLRHTAGRAIDTPSRQAARPHIEPTVPNPRGAGPTDTTLPGNAGINGSSATFDESLEVAYRPVEASADSKSAHSLSEVLSLYALRAGKYFRRVAEIGRQTADALNYAHQQGVVHRDIKPSNLMLDASGHLWVTDFGLARMERGATLTASGDVIGTLRYMSPEQVLGRRGVVDHRSDVYSLGMTLYELLTLEPVFSGEDRQLLLERIADEEPRLPRRINPAIPKDLETIVLKATAKSAHDRYHTARELADDLERFLEAKPIRARRATVAERAFKWSKRHRHAMAAVLVCGIVLVGSLLASIVATTAAWREESLHRQRAEFAATEAQQRQVEAEQERARAEANFDKALRAVDAMLNEVGMEDLERTPQLGLVRRSLLKKAQGFYEEFLQERKHDTQVHFEVGQSWWRLTRIHRLLGEYDQAIEAGRHATDVLSPLAEQHPQNLSYQQTLADAYDELAVVSSFASFHSPAIEARWKELAIREQLVNAAPESAYYRRRLAVTLTDFGNAFSMAQRPPSEYESFFRRSLDTLMQLSTDFPEEDVDVELAHAHHWLANCLLKQHKYHDAERHLRAAMELREKLHEDEPDNPRIKHDFAHALLYFSKLPVPNDRHAEMESTFHRAIHLLTELTVEYPHDRDNWKHLYQAYEFYGGFLMELGRFEEIIDITRKEIEIRNEAVRRFPDAEKHATTGWSYRQLVFVFLELGKTDEAHRTFQLATEGYEQAIARSPERVRNRWYLAYHLATCPPAELQDPERALSIMEEITAEEPDVPEYWSTLGVAYGLGGDWQRSIDILTKASGMAHAEAPVVETFYLAQAHYRLGQTVRAHEFYQLAADEMTRSEHQPYELRKLRAAVAEAIQIDAPLGNPPAAKP